MNSSINSPITSNINASIVGYPNSVPFPTLDGTTILRLEAGEGLVKSGSTITTWEDQSGNGHDVAFSVAPDIGVDPKGRECVSADGTHVGAADYGTSHTQPWVRAIVFKHATGSVAPGQSEYIVDGLDNVSRNIIFMDSAGNISVNSGLTADTSADLDTDWHTMVWLSDGTATEVYLDGVLINDTANPGTYPIKGITLFDRYASHASVDKFSGLLAAVIDITDTADAPGDALALSDYLQEKYA